MANIPRKVDAAARYWSGLLLQRLADPIDADGAQILDFGKLIPKPQNEHWFTANWQTLLA